MLCWEHIKHRSALGVCWEQSILMLFICLNYRNSAQDEKSAQGWIYNMTQFTGKSCNHCVELHCLPAALLLYELMQSKWGNMNTTFAVSFLQYFNAWHKWALEVPADILWHSGTVSNSASDDWEFKSHPTFFRAFKRVYQWTWHPPPPGLKLTHHRCL